MVQFLEIDYGRRELRLGGAAVRLGERAFDVVAVLARAGGEVVSKAEIISAVWNNVAVEDNALQAHISAIRKSLGPARSMLRTIPGRGYCLQTRMDSKEVDSAALGLAKSFLPSAPQQLIGRADAILALTSMLAESRTITITGPGGIGKTALSLAFAHQVRHPLKCEAYFVDLAPVVDPALVVSAVARALGLRTGAETQSFDLIVKEIGDLKLLLVLDNCEHLIGAVASLGERLRRDCPRVLIVSTSREPLRVDGEYVYRLPPLEVPPPTARGASAVYASAAAEMFLAKFRTADSSAEIDEEDAFHVAEICRRLDGIPLAIEFAAARAAALGVAEIAKNLDDRFLFLTEGRRTALPRQQTLRATLDWSYDMLPDAERMLLRRLAVFPGGGDSDTAAGLFKKSVARNTAIVERLGNLVSKSLVVVDRATGRWRLLETIRAYALEKLEQEGEAHEAFQRRAIILCARIAKLGGLRPDNVNRFVAELDNVHAALEWCFSPEGDSRRGVVLTAAYGPVWQQLGLIAECRKRTAIAMEHWSKDQQDDSELLMQLSLQQAVASGYALQPQTNTRSAALTALSIAERAADLGAQLHALYLLWASDLLSGQVARALQTAESFGNCAMELGDELRMATADRVMGHALQMNGDHRRANRLLESSLARKPFVAAPAYSTWTRFDERAMARAVLALGLLLRGETDRGLSEAYRALGEAAIDVRGVSQCIVLHLAVCRIDILTGRLDEARQSIAQLTEISTRHELPQYRLHAKGFEGCLLVKGGEHEAGTSALRHVIEAGEQSGWTTWFPELLGTLAEGYLALGRSVDAETALSKAISAGANGETWYVPELFRLKGKVSLSRGGGGAPTEVEHSFRQSIETARVQGALFWELKSTISLAEMLRSEGRFDEATAALAATYEIYPQTFETPDLRRARAMLAGS